MKFSVGEVIQYLVENYDIDDLEPHNWYEIEDALLPYGLQTETLSAAFEWLESFYRRYDDANTVDFTNHLQSIRVFTDKEKRALSVDEQGFMHRLLSTGLIDYVDLETVLFKLEQLELEDSDSYMLQWVTAMIILGKPGGGNLWGCIKSVGRFGARRNS